MLFKHTFNCSFLCMYPIQFQWKQCEDVYTFFFVFKCALTFAIMGAQCVQQVYGGAAQ